MTTVAIAALSINAPGPAAGELAAAVVAVAGGPTRCGVRPWLPEDARGRVCEIIAGPTVLQVFEAPLPPTMPEAITLTVGDLDAAVDRLREAGFTVATPPGLPITAVTTARGVSIRLRPT